jgi:hypothetical protein
MLKQYNFSENARRQYRVVRSRTAHGRSSIDIECPFCSTVSQAFLWSLAGGGKVCVNKACGAKHSNWGYTTPILGKEDQ